jgi:hypothetical protein
MRFTRRKFAVSALAPAVALAQNPPAPPPSDAPEELTKNARDQVRRNGEALAKINIPIATEPAFQFKP